MSKKITMPTRPGKLPTGDDWVQRKVTPKDPVKLTRISLDVEADIHRELKIHCAKKINKWQSFSGS